MYGYECDDDNRPFIIEDAVPDAPMLPVSSRLPRDEVIVAWRVWKVTQGPAGILQSVFMTNLWPGGIPMKACCAEGGLRHGIHAFTTTKLAEAYLNDQARGPTYVRLVIGEVSLWGRVVIHKSGYRAAYAYPRRILVPHGNDAADAAMNIRRRYGIETEVMA
jgi:hypothetical protein